MNKISGISLVFMLFASLGFAWIEGSVPPSTFTYYSVTDNNFTIVPLWTTWNNTTVVSQTALTIFDASTKYESGATAPLMANGTVISLSVDNVDIREIIIPVESFGSFNITTYIKRLDSYFFTLTCGNGTILSKSITVGASESGFAMQTYLIPSGANLIVTSYGEASNPAYNNTACPKTSTVNVSMRAALTRGAPYSTANITNKLSSAPLIRTDTINYSRNGTYNLYASVFVPSAKLLLSDFRTGNNVWMDNANTTQYCKALLYFNNPYYGNIQLIPMITYFPGVNAFPYFYNTTSNYAYILNGTISYLYDSITGAWYIVPATICNSYDDVASIATLQYNPTGVAGGTVGTVPISVSSISGSCSFVSPTITCTGTDTSNTITSLTLSAFAMGNSTAACSNSSAGASGTLTCTLPSVNGTYNSYFYGTDANQLNYLIVSNSYTIGSTTTNYGRDGYIIALIVVVVAATLMTSSIAVSMVLACFGLFVCVAFGIVPIGTAAIAALFAVVAFAIAYRLKV